MSSTNSGEKDLGISSKGSLKNRVGELSNGHPLVIEGYRVGYRAWKIMWIEGEGKFYLASVAYPEVLWPVREEFVAYCNNREDSNEAEEIPHSSCPCGIYACDAQEDNWYFFGKWVGSVKLYGKTFEEQDSNGTVIGVRAQFAYPYAIFGGICSHCRKYAEIEKIIPYVYTSGMEAYAHCNEVLAVCTGCFEKLARLKSIAVCDSDLVATIAEDYGLIIGEERFKICSK